jgi:hypothetical protein
MAWSQVYLVATLLVDHLTGVNYGFLLPQTSRRLHLDYLSDARWLYIVELEGLACSSSRFSTRPSLCAVGERKRHFDRSESAVKSVAEKRRDGNGNGVIIQASEAFQFDTIDDVLLDIAAGKNGHCDR